MRRLKRNQRLIAYQRYIGMVDSTDSKGNKRAKTELYSDMEYTKACVVFQGSADYRPYGVDDDFSIQVIPDNPIPVNTKSKIYLFEKFSDDDFIQGGMFIPWDKINDVDGGTFWDEGSIVDGGLFVKPIEYYVKSAPRTMNEQRIFCK